MEVPLAARSCFGLKTCRPLLLLLRWIVCRLPTSYRKPPKPCPLHHPQLGLSRRPYCETLETKATIQHLMHWHLSFSCSTTHKTRITWNLNYKLRTQKKRSENFEIHLLPNYFDYQSPVHFLNERSGNQKSSIDVARILIKTLSNPQNCFHD